MIRMIILTILGGGVLALAFYVGVTKELCSRIDSFTQQEQQSMRLNAKACEMPWYKNL